jgi:hypothetical protein
MSRKLSVTEMGCGGSIDGLMAGFSKELDRIRACMQRRLHEGQKRRRGMPKDSGDHQLDLLKFALNLATDLLRRHLARISLGGGGNIKSLILQC